MYVRASVALHVSIIDTTKTPGGRYFMLHSGTTLLLYQRISNFLNIRNMGTNPGGILRIQTEKNSGTETLVSDPREHSTCRRRAGVLSVSADEIMVPPCA